MTESQFIALMHRRLAQVSIGPSAIRKQGAAGLIKILRKYLQEEVKLHQFVHVLSNEAKYRAYLDKHTLNLVSAFPKGAKSWGAARKGLNLFFREVVYSKFFSDKFGIPNDFDAFNSFVMHMEVPLDKDVANGLIAASGNRLPKWNTIKRLTSSESEIFQSFASKIAARRKIARVNLDLIYWRPA